MLKRLADWFEKKRLADWFEKISAAFMVGAFLSDKSSGAAIAFSLICLFFPQYFAKRSGSRE
ncbi:MAG: hypothetical protein LBP38_06780 [Desulfovibrio sp.]|jgi:hypothetical protein|nr:hypothetical protein [Desulfovibrio sp.]